MCGRKMKKQNSYIVKNLLHIISRCLKKKCEKKDINDNASCRMMLLLDQVFFKSLMQFDDPK